MARPSKPTGVSKSRLATTTHAAPATPPAQTPAAPPMNPQAKIQNTPMFVGVLGELDVNKAQTEKRQALIKEIETQLSTRYGASNRLISYVFRFGHAPDRQIGSPGPQRGLRQRLDGERHRVHRHLVFGRDTQPQDHYSRRL